MRLGLGVLDYEVVGEAEVHDGLGGDVDVAIAGGSGEEGSGSGSGCSTDGEAYAAGGDAADEHARAGHAGDEAGGALAFALLGVDVVVSVECVLVAVEGHGDEAELEDGAALEVSAAMGCVNDAGDVGVAGDDFGAVAGDGLYDFAGEAVASLGVLHVDVLINTDGELGSGGNGESDGWRGCCGGASGVGGGADGLAGVTYGSDDRVSGGGRGAGGRGRCGGGNLLGLSCGGGGLNGGGDGVAALIDVLDLLGGVGGGCGGLSLIERLVLLALATGEQGERDERGSGDEAELYCMS